MNHKLQHRSRLRYPWAVDGFTIDFDRHALPLTHRRDTAIQLAMQAFDLDHLEREYAIALSPADFTEYGIPKTDLRKIAARLVSQGYRLDDLERRYGVTLQPEDFDPD
ncbi:hypothetical protein SB767_28600, partial [Bacillus sp. SIMBA_069]